MHFNIAVRMTGAFKNGEDKQAAAKAIEITSLRGDITIHGMQEKNKEILKYLRYRPYQIWAHAGSGTAFFGFSHRRLN